MTATAIDTEAAPAGSRITARVRDELGAPVLPAVRDVAQELARRYGPHTVAVLLYGACRRARSTEGLLDFYVLVDGYPVVGMSVPGAALARLLPPTVHHHRQTVAGTIVSAKVAVISLAQVRRRLRAGALDGSLWARFCQPMTLAYARGPEVVNDVAELLGGAVLRAAEWAARLGPDSGPAGDFWTALFRATYGAELRPEAAGRALHIYEADAARFDAVLVDGWRALGLNVGAGAELVNPLAPKQRPLGRWRVRRGVGKAINVARLVKAAFTFEGGAEYIAGKIERHSGHHVPLTGFQRRHPVLAAPAFLWWAIRHRLVR